MTEQTIWKYVLPLQDLVSIGMPEQAEILSAGVQDGNLCLWAKVNPKAKVSIRKFSIVGTGHPMTKSAKFIGTVHQHPFVWHVFEGAVR